MADVLFLLVLHFAFISFHQLGNKGQSSVYGFSIARSGEVIIYAALPLFCRQVDSRFHRVVNLKRENDLLASHYYFVFLSS